MKKTPLGWKKTSSSSGNDEKDDDFARVFAASVRGRLLAPSPASLSLSLEDIFLCVVRTFYPKTNNAMNQNGRAKALSASINQSSVLIHARI